MQKEKIILYGAGCLAQDFLKREDWREYYQVVSIVDSNVNKHGRMLEGIEIISLRDALKLDWDSIVICARENAYHEIRNTLDRAGIPEEKMLTFFQAYKCKKFRDDKASVEKKKTGLVIIFNHRYEKNLPKLRKIYGNKFSEIRFLMPFYIGGEKDVISVI